MTVRFQDRDEKVEHFHLALKVAGMFDDYKWADLIYQIHEKVKATGGEGTLKDIVELKVAWERKWEDYDKELKENEG